MKSGHRKGANCQNKNLSVDQKKTFYFLTSINIKVKKYIYICLQQPFKLKVMSAEILLYTIFMINQFKTRKVRKGLNANVLLRTKVNVESLMIFFL